VSADLVLVGGNVYTVDASGRWADAVAVTAGRIVAVGSDAEIRAHAGPRTQVVDLTGRMLVPGFQDAHVHAQSGGMDRLRVDLSPLHDVGAYAEAIGTYAMAHPGEPWVLGGGWSMDVFAGGTPPRAILDAIVPDRPVFLSNRDNHAAWVNSRALEVARVDARTGDPADGRIEREPDGSPQGTLHEGAMQLVRRAVPDPTARERERALLIAQTYLHSLGITGWQEAIVGTYPTMPDATDIYPALARRGELTARVVGALWLERGGDLGGIDDRVEELTATRERTSVGRYRAGAIKIMLDGVCESFTAAMSSPYLDLEGRATGGRGLAYFEPAFLRAIVTRLDAAGFQVHLHAIGDRAARDGLDALAAARTANGALGRRHHMAHLHVVDPVDIPRFHALDVAANAQMLWAAHDPQMDELTIPFLGSERAGWQYPFGSLAAAGATLCAGSDWPVSTPDVMQALFVGTRRTSPPGNVYGVASDEPLLPHEALTLPQALRAYTMGSAFVNHLDEETGSIEIGKAADLVVLSANLFEPDALAEAHPLLTLVDGVAVHEGPGL
jgi:predicted amidohydrolase YtcJ